MGRNARMNQKRAVAQAVLHLMMAQDSLAEFWQVLVDDGRAWHELAGLPEPITDPADPARVLTGADVLATMLEGVEGLKSGIEQVTIAFWNLTLDQLASQR